MNMFEEAIALSGMLKMRDMTQAEIAAKLGVSQSYVANKIRLLRLSDKARRRIIDTGLCERQARLLLRLGSEEKILYAIEKMAEGKLTVAESEIAVDMLVESEIPKRLSGLTKYDRILSFERFINDSLESLASIGISVDKRTEIKNDKRYITILVDDG